MDQTIATTSSNDLAVVKERLNSGKMPTLIEIQLASAEVEQLWMECNTRLGEITAEWPTGYNTVRRLLEKHNPEFSRLHDEMSRLMGEKDELYKIARTLPARTIEDIAALVDLVLDSGDVSIQEAGDDRRLLHHLLHQLERLAPSVAQGALFRQAQWTGNDAPSPQTGFVY